LLQALYVNHLSSIEHSNVVCETDFSPLARMLSPLRKGRFKMAAVQRKMMLLLNKGLWHPLPERAAYLE